MNSNVSQYAKYIFEPVDTNSGNWQLAHEDTDMKVFKVIIVVVISGHFPSGLPKGIRRGWCGSRST